MKERLAVAGLVVLITMTGCVGGGEDADVGVDLNVSAQPVETDATGAEILDDAVSAAEDAETYRVRSETHMDLSALFGLSISTNTTGSFDRGEDLAYTHTEGEGGAEVLVFSGGEEFETTVYQTGDTRYTRRSNESTQGGWNITTVDGPLSPGLGDLVSTVEGTDATLEGVDEVNGREAYLLSLNVSPKSLGKAFARNLETHGNNLGNDGEGGGNSSEGDVETSKAYLWVDRESNRPVRFAYRVWTEFSGKGEDVSGSMEFLTDTRYTEYGDDVSIEIPDEVK